MIFTGSSENGRDVLSELARSNTPAVMELSGEDAVLVLADADLPARRARFVLRHPIERRDDLHRAAQNHRGRASRGRPCCANVPSRRSRIADRGSFQRRGRSASRCGIPVRSRRLSLLARCYPSARARQPHLERLRAHQRSHRPDRGSAHAIRRCEGERFWRHARRRGLARNDVSSRRRRAAWQISPAFRRALRRRRAAFFLLHPRRARPRAAALCRGPRLVWRTHRENRNTNP